MAQRLRGALGAGARSRGQAIGGGSPSASANSRRVVVKVRVVQVGADWGKKAARLHLGYVERDGVERDGGPGRLYDAMGSVERRAFDADLPSEKHQFRVVLSPEDGHELDLQAYVRTYMQRIERDLGQRLRWAAVSHYNTDNPHAHVVIRGLDAQGREVRMARQYVSHGLRHRAEELATEELGPRPERSRVKQLQREASLEGYTSLDRSLERRAVAGLVRISRGERDPHLWAALQVRLKVLETLGFAQRVRRGEWRLEPRLRSELEHMERRAEGLRAIAAVLPVSPAQCRVVDRTEPREGHRAELERGVQGVLRWKGLDEQGQFCVVLETTGGAAYHLLVSNRVAAEVKVGQVLELKRALDKDERIEQVARAQGWKYDVTGVSEPAREAFRRRLEQLERMQLAIPEGRDQWRLQADFRAVLTQGKQQPYWQMLSLWADAQPLRAQVTYLGPVWLDRVRIGECGWTGFGREVREALRDRHEHLRALGLNADDRGLAWQLRERQRQQFERTLASVRGGVAVQPREGVQGVLTVHRAENGQRFAEVRTGERFAIYPVSRDAEVLSGRQVRFSARDRRLVLVALEPDRGRSK